jgi:HEAT repeat protein/ankyrin repeat protein/predicted acylesterase/phospholipase RssA
MASHEELYAVKEPLALDQLFEPKDDTKTPSKILILGRAGIGKTILCQYLAVQWATDDFSEFKNEEQKNNIGNYLRQKFDAVFWVRLREVADRPRDSNTVAEVINQFCLRGLNKLSLEELDAYIKSQSHKILFILDGYDEITDLIGQAQYAHLTDFLNDIVHHQYILVTSRPLAIESLGQSRIKFDRRLENIGFTNENIEAYVHYFMGDTEKPDQAKPMLRFLKTHPSVWGIAHIPINLELLSWLWLQGGLVLKQGQIMTLSKLYQTIVTYVQDIYEKKSRLSQSYFSGASLENQENKFSFSGLVNEFLEHLAYVVMQQDSLLIPKSQLQLALSQTLKKRQKQSTRFNQEALLRLATHKLGFLRATGQGGRSQLDQSHYFIHLSFQEFYAASYIIRVLNEPAETQEKNYLLEHIRTEKYTPRYQLMLWMTAGLLYQHGIEKEREFSLLEQFWEAILSEPRDRIGFHHLRLVMHCLDECEADDNLPLHKRLIDQQLRWFDSYAKHADCYWGHEYVNELVRCPLLQNAKPIVDHLLKNLKKGDPKVKCQSIQVLGQLQDINQEIIDAFLKFVKNSDEHLGVRNKAVESLGRLSNPSEAVIKALLNASPLGYLGSDYDYYHHSISLESTKAIYILHRLANSDEAILAILLNALQDKDNDVRNKAVGVLGWLPNPNNGVLVALSNAFKDKSNDIKIRRKVIHLFSQFQNSNNVILPTLLDASEDEDILVRQDAITALKRFNNPSEAVIVALLNALKNENTKHFVSLPKIQNPNEAIITVLVNALKDRNQNVRNIAADALSQIPNLNEVVVAALLQDEWGTIRSNVVKVVSRLANSSEVVPAILLSLLKSADNIYVRKSAVNALGQLLNPSDEVIHALLTVLKDKNVAVRGAAVLALGQLPNLSEVVVAALLNALKDESKDVRKNAVHALGQLSNLSEVVISALLNATQSEDGQVKTIVIEVLGRLPNPNEAVLAAFLNALKDESKDVRKNAVHALAQLPNLNEVVVAALLNATKDEERQVKTIAIEVLGRLPNPNEAVVAVLLNELKDKNNDVRNKAIEILTQLPNPNEAIADALLNALKIEYTIVNEQAIKRLLSRFQNPNATIIAAFFKVCLRKNLKDSKKDVVDMLIRWFRSYDDVVIDVLLDTMEDNNKILRIFSAKTKEKEMNDAIISFLSQLITNDIFILFEKLKHRQSLLIYLSSYFKENHLLYIDHTRKQLGLLLYNKIHKISFRPELFIHLEKQIIVVAEQEQYPLDIIFLNHKHIPLLQRQFQQSILYQQLISRNRLGRQMTIQSLIENFPLSDISQRLVGKLHSQNEIIEEITDVDSDVLIATKDQYGNTLLHMAVMAGRLDVVNVLDQKGFNLKESDILSLSPLCLAAVVGQIDVVMLLKQKSGWVSSPFDFYSIEGHRISLSLDPFHCAILANNKDIVDYLSQEDKGGLNFEVPGLGNVLHLAVLNGQSEMLKYLLDHFDVAHLLEQTSTEGHYNVVSFAAANNQMACLLVLWAHYNRDQQLKEKKRKDTFLAAFCDAVQNERSEVVEALLAWGIDPNGVFSVGKFINTTLKQIAIEHKTQNPSSAKAKIIENMIENAKAEHTENHFSLLQLANSPIENLIFYGGGANGVAYIGALEVLADFLHQHAAPAGEEVQSINHIKRVAGASVGAITACLLAIGYSIEEVKARLMAMDFNLFLDDIDINALREEQSVLTKLAKFAQQKEVDTNPFRLRQTLWDLLRQTGIFSENYFLQWIGKEITTKLQQDAILYPSIELFLKMRLPVNEAGQMDFTLLTFGDLAGLVKLDTRYKHLHVFMAQRKPIAEANTIESMNSNNPQCADLLIVDAVRCSMSSPGVFVPCQTRYRFQWSNGESIQIELLNVSRLYVDGVVFKNSFIEEFDQLRYFPYLGGQGDLYKPILNPYSLGLRLVPSSQKVVVRGRATLAQEEEKKQVDQGSDFFKTQSEIIKTTVIRFLASPRETVVSTSLQKEVTQLVRMLASFLIEVENTIADYQHVGESRTIEIPDAGITAIDFDLTTEDKVRLIEEGRKATYNYFGIRSAQYKKKNLTQCDKKKYYPIQCAVMEGDLNAMVSLLKQEKSEKHVVTKEDNTLLHLAAQYGHLPIVEWLIDKEDFDSHQKNKQGQTPTDLAQEANHHEVVVYLRQEDEFVIGWYRWATRTITIPFIQQFNHVLDHMALPVAAASELFVDNDSGAFLFDNAIRLPVILDRTTLPEEQPTIISIGSSFNQPLSVNSYLGVVVPYAEHYARKYSFFTFPWNKERSLTEQEQQRLITLLGTCKYLNKNFLAQQKSRAAKYSLFIDKFAFIKRELRTVLLSTHHSLNKGRASVSQLSEIQDKVKRIKEVMRQLAIDNKNLRYLDKKKLVFRLDEIINSVLLHNLNKKNRIQNPSFSISNSFSQIMRFYRPVLKPLLSVNTSAKLEVPSRRP